MARIAGINIPPHKHAEVALTAIYGIGRSTARKICAASGIQPSTKIKDLTESEIELVRNEITKYTIEGDLRRTVSMNIKRLMDLGTLSRHPSPARAAVARPAHPYQRTHPQGSAARNPQVDTKHRT